MPIEITVRHITLNDAVQAHAREMAEKLVATFPAIEHVRIVFDSEGPKYSVARAAQGGQATTVEASAADLDAFAAINALFDIADARLRKAIRENTDQMTVFIISQRVSATSVTETVWSRWSRSSNRNRSGFSSPSAPHRAITWMGRFSQSMAVSLPVIERLFDYRIPQPTPDYKRQLGGNIYNSVAICLYHRHILLV